MKVSQFMSFLSFFRSCGVTEVLGWPKKRPLGFNTFDFSNLVLKLFASLFY